MIRLKSSIFGLVLGLILLNGVDGRRVNTTFYDTNSAHVTYDPQDDICIQWSHHIFWKTCDARTKPWQSEIYSNQGKLATLHRSLDHEQPSMTINFRGSAIWLYGPPRSQLPAIPVDHKICLHENHRVASDIVCYRVDVAEAYSAAEDYNSPVVIFAKGGLQDHEHRIVVSVSDPAGEVDKHRGIQFSHAVYTTDRPTPWPADEDSWRFREVVMHDTHPLLSYLPERPASSSLWSRSSDSSGWFSKTYMSEDGSRVSWHELHSRGESNQDQWGIDVTITAGAVALYGIPKAHIAESDSLSDVCVQIDSGACEAIDIKHAYLNAEHHYGAVLLWQNQALDPYQQTQISVRLMKTDESKLKVFPFKAIHYYERQEYSSPDPLIGRIEDVTIAHDDKAIVYHPERRCLEYFSWWCSKWFDPWAWKEAGSSESLLTYRSTVSSYRETEDPSITLDFRGSAVYVYGAPKSFMKDGFASQHVCINDTCHIVDVEQAYLNAPMADVQPARIRPFHSFGTSNGTTLSPSHPELDPVLIWSMTGLDDKVQHSLHLALAGLPSQDNAEMSFVKVVYTNVTYEAGKSRPDTPVPQPDYSYEGPVYPPHAIEWAPRLPSPKPDLPSDPEHPLPSPNPAPPNRPQHPPPPPPPFNPTNPSTGGTSILLYILWPVCGAISLALLLIFLVASCGSTTNSERQRILPDTPPPPYVPTPPFSSRPATPQPRPNLSQAPPKDQNNAGPCPGFNASASRPEYTGTSQNRSRASGQTTSHLSANAPALVRWE